MFIDGFVDISAGVVFTVLAGLVLGSVDGRAALVLLIPLVGVAMATRTLDAPHQALPRRRPRRRVGGQRPARRRDGRRDHGQGQQRHRPDHRPPAQVGRRTPSNRGARSRARRERVGLQPRRRRRRARPGAADRCRRHGVGQVQRRRAGRVLRVPRLAELPATHGRPHAGPPQAGRRRLRPHERAGRRHRVAQHRHRSPPADRPASTSANRPQTRPARSGTTRRARRSPASARTTPPAPACTTSASACRRGSFVVLTGPDRLRQEHAAPRHARSCPPGRRHAAMSRGTATCSRIAPRS